LAQKNALLAGDLQINKVSFTTLNITSLTNVLPLSKAAEYTVEYAFGVGGHGNGTIYGQGGSFQNMMARRAYSFTDKPSL